MKSCKLTKTQRYRIYLAPYRCPLTGASLGEKKEIILDAIDCSIDRPNDEEAGDSAMFVVTGENNRTIFMAPLERIIECVSMDVLVSQQEPVKRPNTHQLRQLS